jgi:outer membrane immunogenic protein
LDQRLRWFGTVRGRLGATVAPTVLAYVTGGLAYGEIKTDMSLSGFTLGGGPAPLATASSSTTKAGWTVGAGIEARLGGNWTGKIEYLYMDLGSVSGSVLNPFTAPPTTFTFSSHITDNIVRVGLNYKFGYGPVVAKY